MDVNKCRTLTVVTGASRGIGREICLQMADIVGDHSAFLLTSRGEAEMIELKKEIREKNPSSVVWIVVCDMGNFNETAQKSFDTVLREITGDELDSFSQFFLFHNAGTVGDVTKKCSKLSDEVQWQQYLSTNLISMVLLNNLLLKWVTPVISKKRFIINITSLCAVAGFPSLTQYSVGKAAREAFFRGLAVEDASLKVLNYSPGPVDTQMHVDVAEGSYDATIRANFSGSSTEASEVHREALTAPQTVKTLLEYLTTSFESGTRVDYFDLQTKTDE